ncbi:MAG TPA: ATP-dependent zinc metalloprotease FtsH [Patescibacteria group bacterium]|nr:ATP-dependent zinc metalloprotease FtsH [Patescibacteria group bacterium]
MAAQPRQRTRQIIFIIIIFLLGSGLYNLFGAPYKNEAKEVPLSEVTTALDESRVDKIEIDGDKVTAHLKDGSQLKSYKEAGVSVSEYGITPEKVNIDIKNPNRGSIWPTLISVILPFILLAIFIWLLMRQAQGANMRAMSFGKSQARLANNGRKKVTFKDVAGLYEAKQELVEIVDFLKNPEKYRRIGAEIPKGVLLIGAPGVGKTLLAKAVAGEAGVPFFSLSASEFVEMFVGVGAARVRDLFQKAKRNAPTVIFVDELDAIGRQRGAGLGGSHDEREQTLNQILVEMDGFETDTRVIVMAATNRPDVLDPALLRPGRFDRRVVLAMPDKKERFEILQLHAANKPIEKSVELEKVASSTAGMSGADLRNIVNEAAILAARDNSRTISQGDFNRAMEKVLLGPERRNRVLSPQERKITAYHEAGHAIVGKVLKHTDPVHKISIISRGMALGYTWSVPEEDKYLLNRDQFEDSVAQLLGGRAAEVLAFGQATTGASNDLEHATKIARDMVKVYGMSPKLGPVKLGEKEELVFLGRELGEHKTYSEEIAKEIDEEIKRIIVEAEQRAVLTLKKYKIILDRLAELLIKQEIVERAEFDALFGKSN